MTRITNVQPLCRVCGKPLGNPACTACGPVKQASTNSGSVSKSYHCPHCDGRPCRCSTTNDSAVEAATKIANLSTVGLACAVDHVREQGISDIASILRPYFTSRAINREVAQRIADGLNADLAELVERRRHFQAKAIGFPCIGTFRTRPDENDGKEFFYHAIWHDEAVPSEGERQVAGYFVPADAFRRHFPAKDAASSDTKELREAEWATFAGMRLATNRAADTIDALRAELAAAKNVLERVEWWKKHMSYTAPELMHQNVGEMLTELDWLFRTLAAMKEKK